MKKFNRVSEVLNSAENLDNEYKEIAELSKNCRFSDCTHTTECDCAVKEAISEGILSEETLKSYIKTKKEAAYVAERKNKTKAIDYMRKKKLF